MLVLWSIGIHLIPWRLVRKPASRVRVVFDDDDEYLRAPLPSATGPLEDIPDAVQKTPDEQRENQTTSIPIKPAKSAPRIIPAEPTTPAPAPDDDAQQDALAAGRTGDPLAALMNIQEQATPKPFASSFDEMNGAVRQWLDSNNWSSLTDVWADASTFYGKEELPYAPVGRIPLIAMSRLHIFLLQIVDLSGHNWTISDTVNGTNTAEWMATDADGNEISYPSPITAAAQNYDRFTSSHGVMLREFNPIEVLSLTLMINGDISNRDDLDTAWGSHTHMIIQYFDQEDIHGDSLDEALGQHLGEDISLEDTAPDKILSEIRRASTDAAHLHGKEAA